MTRANMAPVLMVQGTASHVGKSLFVAALCRWFASRGLRVAPFKAQNMSLNAAVTPGGGEIGRAQMLQAMAARAVPVAAMNPILLKPETETRSQVVVMGRAECSRSARGYFDQHDRLWPVVAGALDELRASYDLVIAEGAGSPAEINLRDRDLVNMRVARHAGAAVVLLGDIERGGVFAALAGTLHLLDEHERRLVRGMVINKFRGDVSLVAPGPAMLAVRTGVPVLGVVPFLQGLALPEEDALPPDVTDDAAAGRPGTAAVASLSSAAAGPSGISGLSGASAALDIAVIALPHLANFDDFDPLRYRAGVRLRFVRGVAAFGAPDLVILPGSKTTIADLHWLRHTGLADRIIRHRRGGRPVFGVCGGFQMLGVAVKDPEGLESPVPAAEGLGLLAHQTVFQRVKQTRQVRVELEVAHGPFGQLSGLTATGYEIRMGTSRGPDRPLARIVGDRAGRSVEPYLDGGIDREGVVLGTYVHGLLHHRGVREAILEGAAQLSGRRLPRMSDEPDIDAELDRAAAHFARHVDLLRIAGWVGAA